jgi:hypothetical protein
VGERDIIAEHVGNQSQTMNVSGSLGIAACVVKRVTTARTALGPHGWRLALLGIFLRKLTVPIQVFIHVVSAQKKGITDGHAQNEMLA